MKASSFPARVPRRASAPNVKLTDKRELKAEVVRVDKMTDVAVLKVEASGLGVDGKPVKSAEELKGAVDGAGKHVALLVQRGEGRIFIPVQIG